MHWCIGALVHWCIGPARAGAGDDVDDGGGSDAVLMMATMIAVAKAIMWMMGAMMWTMIKTMTIVRQDEARTVT